MVSSVRIPPAGRFGDAELRRRELLAKRFAEYLSLAQVPSLAPLVKEAA